MSRRSSRLLALALVVVLAALAGCSGSGALSADDPAPDRDPYDVDEPVEPSIDADDGPPDPDAESLPPGLSADGIEDTAVLLEHGEDALRNASYTVDVDRTVDDGTETDRIVQRIRIDSDGDRYVQEEARGPSIDGGERSVEGWADRNGTLTRHVMANGTVVYNERTPEFGVVDFVGIVRTLERAHDPTVERVDGLPGYVVRAETETPDVRTEFDAVSARLVVGDDGLIRSGYRTWETDDAGRSRHEAFVYRDVGETTVDRPYWYEEALEAERESEDDADADDRASGEDGESTPADVDG